jgi:hypothetical protein
MSVVTGVLWAANIVDAVVAGDALKDPDRYGNPLIFVSDHGPGTKTLRFRNLLRDKTRRYIVFLEGRYWVDVIKRFGFQDAADWLMTGVPKLDPFFRPGYYDRAAILRRLGLSPERATVVFAPSYRGEDGSEGEVEVAAGEVDADGVEAKIRIGILELRLPKKEEAKARRVEVRAE